MGLKRELKAEKKEFWDIFSRFKKRDFSGNTGQAIKNSGYQLTTSLVMKIGSLFFTIIVARLLLPELFGLYGLALSVLVLFTSLSDLGLGNTLLTFIAGNEQKKPEKAKAYFFKILKLRTLAICLSFIILFSISYYLANSFYNKPIFLALLAGALYIPVSGMLSFISMSFLALNNFKASLLKEITYQITRLVLVPLAILLLISSNFSTEIILLGIIIALSLSFLSALILLLILSKKNLSFLKTKKSNLSKKETKALFAFTLPLSVTVLSGMFFGYIDILILGKFVESEFIGFYQAAFSLATSGAALLSFASSSMFPIFVRLTGQRLERGFKKALRAMIVVSLLGGLFTYLVAPFAIRIIFGPEYLSATPLLRIFSLIVFLLPLVGIYSTYYISNKKTLSNSIILLSATAINIILNFVFIIYLIPRGMIYAVGGVCVSTVISKFAHLFGLMVFRKK